MLHLLLVAALIACSALARGQDIVAPQRIASLNLCADQLLLTLVERRRIVSLSYLAVDRRFAVMAGAAAGLPLNHGAAEEVVPLQPDLILAGAFNDPLLRQAIERLGYRMEILSQPTDFAGAQAQILAVGEMVARRDQAAALVADMQRRLQTLQEQAAPRRARLAVNYGPNGMVAGADTLMHSVITAAGWRNLAAELGVVGYGELALEQLVARRPEVMIVEHNPLGTEPSLAARYLDHPALHATLARAQVVSIPVTWLQCPGPHLVDAVVMLVATP